MQSPSTPRVGEEKKGGVSGGSSQRSVRGGFGVQGQEGHSPVTYVNFTMRVYECVRVHVLARVWVHVPARVWVHVPARVWVHVPARVRVHVRARVRVHVRAQVRVHVRARVRGCADRRVHGVSTRRVYVHACVCVGECVLRLGGGGIPADVWNRRGSRRD